MYVIYRRIFTNIHATIYIYILYQHLLDLNKRTKKNFSHVGFELGTTGNRSRGLDHCTTVVTSVAVHKNKYSRKQKRSHCEHALQWIFRWVGCHLGHFALQASNLTCRMALYASRWCTGHIVNKHWAGYSVRWGANLVRRSSMKAIWLQTAVRNTKWWPKKGQTAFLELKWGKSAGSLRNIVVRRHVQTGAGHADACPQWWVPCGHVHAALKSSMSLYTTHPVTLGNIFFSCHSTNLFVASHPFGQNLLSICMSNPNEMVNFLICLTFSTKNLS